MTRITLEHWSYVLWHADGVEIDLGYGTVLNDSHRRGTLVFCALELLGVEIDSRSCTELNDLFHRGTLGLMYFGTPLGWKLTKGLAWSMYCSVSLPTSFLSFHILDLSSHD